MKEVVRNGKADIDRRVEMSKRLVFQGPLLDQIVLGVKQCKSARTDLIERSDFSWSVERAE
ncbi:MAG: hypothetical protein CFE43_18780 [Burkholderiales bacterium PBB3]|nr:MAG: hypothetical protein CFE43_18780 [Burkholderiales bacterium PBB3]